MRLILLLLFLLTPYTIAAPLLLKPEDALTELWPRANIKTETVYLTEDQKKKAEDLSGEVLTSRMYKQFVISDAKGRIGVAYLDSHKVRSSGETLLIAISVSGEDSGQIKRVEVVSFFEPAEYLPRSNWLEQFRGKTLDEQLRLKRGILPITGATLTARAATAASRRVLAIHRVLTQ